MGTKPSRPIILDGVRLSAERAPGLAERAAAVRRGRGRAPGLGLLAFSDKAGELSYVPRKVRACAEAGVVAVPLQLPWSATTETARARLRGLIESAPLDAIFIEFPFPDQVDAEAVVALVPEALDVDVMTEGRVRRYLEENTGPPPITVSAALELLDAYDVEIAGVAGIIVAESLPFTEMFRAALSRRGARMGGMVSPDATGLAARVREAGLVIVAASSPGLVKTRDVAPGAVAIDAGYFNPGGRGDIDTSCGTEHLAALAPVPGAIGPMTVSALVERVIEFAEGRAPDE